MLRPHVHTSCPLPCSSNACSAAFARATVTSWLSFAWVMACMERVTFNKCFSFSAGGAWEEGEEEGEVVGEEEGEVVGEVEGEEQG